MPLTNYFFFFLSSCDIKTKKPQPRAKSQATTFHNQSLSPSLFPQFNFPGGLFSIKSCRIYQWLCCAPVTITTSPSLKSVKFRSFYPQSLGGKREVGTPTFYLYQSTMRIIQKLESHITEEDELQNEVVCLLLLPAPLVSEIPGSKCYSRPI